MTLVDTSAWIEFFRASEHAADRTLTALVEEGGEVSLTEPVVMEVLAGARSLQDERRLRSSLLSFPVFAVRGLADYEQAAFIFRTCRAAGSTPRSLVDCLIAAVAIREGVRVLHNDADFDVIARHTGLRIHPLRRG